MIHLWEMRETAEAGPYPFLQRVNPVTYTGLKCGHTSAVAGAALTSN